MSVRLGCRGSVLIGGLIGMSSYECAPLKERYQMLLQADICGRCKHNLICGHGGPWRGGVCADYTEEL